MWNAQYVSKPPFVDDGAEPEDGLGSLDAPPGAGDGEAITDHMPARPSTSPVAIGQPDASAWS